MILSNHMKVKIGNGELQRKIREQTVGYMLAALGLVVGLAWNEAIRSLIEFIFPLRYNNVTAKFIYAAVLTILLVLLSVHINRLFVEKNQEEK